MPRCSCPICTSEWPEPGDDDGGDDGADVDEDVQGDECVPDQDCEARFECEHGLCVADTE
jgi:hypothetical protein